MASTVFRGRTSFSDAARYGAGRRTAWSSARRVSHGGPDGVPASPPRRFNSAHVERDQQHESGDEAEGDQETASAVRLWRHGLDRMVLGYGIFRHDSSFRTNSDVRAARPGEADRARNG